MNIEKLRHGYNIDDDMEYFIPSSSLYKNILLYDSDDPFFKINEKSDFIKWLSKNVKPNNFVIAWGVGDTPIFFFREKEDLISCILKFG